jgi:uncharacterized RmlC-like cupin family protein
MGANGPQANRKSPRRVAAGDLVDYGKTSGVLRLEAFADQSLWVGSVINAPGEISRWHIHPGHDTYLYVVEGVFRMEFGPGGRDSMEFSTGDFGYIPAGIVHREGNPVDRANKGILFRTGEGPLVADADGPEEG